MEVPGAWSRRDKVWLLNFQNHGYYQENQIVSFVELLTINEEQVGIYRNAV